MSQSFFCSFYSFIISSITVSLPFTTPPSSSFFFFKDPATTEISPFPLHDPLPIYDSPGGLLIAQGTKGLYRHRQSKLLSQKATNESATPNFTAIFQAPQGY